MDANKCACYFSVRSVQKLLSRGLSLSVHHNTPLKKPRISSLHIPSLTFSSKMYFIRSKVYVMAVSIQCSSTNMSRDLWDGATSTEVLRRLNTQTDGASLGKPQNASKQLALHCTWSVALLNMQTLSVGKQPTLLLALPILLTFSMFRHRTDTMWVLLLLLQLRPTPLTVVSR